MRTRPETDPGPRRGPRTRTAHRPGPPEPEACLLTASDHVPPSTSCPFSTKLQDTLRQKPTSKKLNEHQSRVRYGRKGGIIRTEIS